MKITAAVCTHNRAGFVSHAIDSLLRQSLPPSDYEIIVVDNGSTDETAALLQRYVEAPGDVTVRSYTAPAVGLSHARNLAVHGATGEVIAFLDDDAIASPNWLQALLDAYAAFPEAWIVGGRVEALWQAPRPDWLTDELLLHLAILDLGEQRRPLRNGEEVYGVNFSVRKQAFQELGLFNADLGRRGALLLGGEEVELQTRVLSRGKQIIYAPDALVRHVIPARRLSKRHFIGLAFGKGQSAAIRFWQEQGHSAAGTRALQLCASTAKVCLQSLLHLHQARRRIQCARKVAYLGGFWLQVGRRSTLALRPNPSPSRPPLASFLSRHRSPLPTSRLSPLASSVSPHCFEPDDLIPACWRQEGSAADFRIYNPALAHFGGRLLMAYRLDSGQGTQGRRRIALAALDEQLQVAAGAVVPFSDTVREGGIWHYDPRFLVYGDRLFIHYNNNVRTRPNQIFLVELDPDSLEAKSPARPLHLDGSRQEIEKNWMLFAHDSELFAVYCITPHTILRLSLDGQGPIVCRMLHSTKWDVSAYADRYGERCGGAPPQRHGNTYVSFFHSRRPISRFAWLLRYWPEERSRMLPRSLAAVERRVRRPLAQVRYSAGAYAFAAAPPFEPLWISPAPILRPEDEPVRQRRQRLNRYANGIVYPCGAVPWPGGCDTAGDGFSIGQNWLVSYGLHDERCCLRRVHLPFDSLELHNTQRFVAQSVMT